MNIVKFLFSVSAVATVNITGIAQAATLPETGDATAPENGAASTPTRASDDMVTTGVAKGRDRLDSATSTSALREVEIQKFGPRSVGDLLRNIPGIRSEASQGEGSSNISIRGLPIASSGAKFVQLQEDGLPVLEFGDIVDASADQFLRLDLNIAQVEAIRGGSASTFASNSPGGIINFQSKTGEVEGGAIAFSAGLDYDLYRADFDYGARLSDDLRFHVGGFYRQGEGPRRTGYDAQKGGQIKLNVTRSFDGGYIRFYGKYLDDRTPYYDAVPFRVTGTDAKPKFQKLPGFDGVHDTMLSRYIRSNIVLDRANNLAVHDIADGQRARSASFGVEARVDVAGWTVIDRFRYAAMSGTLITPSGSFFAPATSVANEFPPEANLSFSYANGPQARQAIADPSTLNGNGLAAVINMLDTRLNSLDNVTNDVRASRIWNVGGGDLTTTVGFYASRQTIDRDALWTTRIAEVRGDGRATLLDLTTPSGTMLTQNGYYSFNRAYGFGMDRRSVIVDYAVNAPFLSANYHRGKIAIGASARYDYGTAQGRLYGLELFNGGVSNVERDMDGNGVISPAERRVAVTPLGAPAPLDYTYRYLSYSSGINFRIAEPLSVFARYSRGARVNADRILFTPALNTLDGSLRIGRPADPVKQAEAGVKFRRESFTLNLTGFWARTRDRNIDPVTAGMIVRDYEAAGLEFEGGIRRGIFAINGGATYTDAKIANDDINPAIEGNTPRRQAKLIFQATPQITTDRFSLGAVFIGTTGSFAQDDNVLRIPGFVTTNAFAQVRATDQVTLLLNASNLFDVRALTAIDNASIPESGIVNGRVLNGRTISATVRFDF